MFANKDDFDKWVWCFLETVYMYTRLWTRYTNSRGEREDTDCGDVRKRLRMTTRQYKIISMIFVFL